MDCIDVKYELELEYTNYDLNSLFESELFQPQTLYAWHSAHAIPPFILKQYGASKLSDEQIEKIIKRPKSKKQSPYLKEIMGCQYKCNQRPSAKEEWKELLHSKSGRLSSFVIFS